MTREEKWTQYIEQFQVDIPESRIENEMNLIRMERRHQMQYDMLTGSQMHLMPEMELDEQMEEIRQTAIYEIKAEFAIKDILDHHNFTISRDDLEEEAKALACRQNTSLAMIKDFFGEDLAMLERDIKERMAIDWACAQV